VVVEIGSSLVKDAASTHDLCEINFAVRDTGIGIPQEKMDLLFKPFSQVDATSTRNYGGTGLGLVISKRLIELMDGSISVTSEVGKGTSFLFTIPAPIAPAGTKKSNDVLNAKLQGRRLLVVEDSETSRALLATHARRWGMDVVALASALEVLKQIETGEKFDVAVIDQDIPGMSGVTLATAMREFPQTENMPMIFLDFGDHADPAHLPRGFFTSIPKPWKASTLQRELVHVLGPDATRPAAVVAPGRVLEPQALEETPFRILVVEDNSVNLQVIITVLRALGYQPDVAENGRIGLEKLAARRYDLILLDIQMPDVDGLTVARRVRAEMNTPPPTIVAITAGVTPEDRQKCFDAGMDDFVMKPFKISTLKEIILKYTRPEKLPA